MDLIQVSLVSSHVVHRSSRPCVSLSDTPIQLTLFKVLHDLSMQGGRKCLNLRARHFTDTLSSNLVKELFLEQKGHCFVITDNCFRRAWT